MRRPAVFAVFAASPLLPGGFEYERFRRFMTDEVVAAITAARAAGATDILVSDSHGNGENLLIEQLPEDVTVGRSWPRPLMMMQGIDSTFHAALFIGYHAGAANPAGVRAHTISSARLQDVRLNGRSMPEAGINAAIAGHYGVPVVMISGDDAAVAEAQALIGDKVTAALRRLDRFRPFVLRAPITLDIRFKHYRPAEMLAYLPIVARPDAHSIRYVGPDMMAISKFLEFVMTYAVTLEP